jgi:hypothetical protein
MKVILNLTRLAGSGPSPNPEPRVPIYFFGT